MGSAKTPNLTTTRPGPAASELGVAPGDRIGRFVAQERLGVGGMAVVFAAHDPELDRRVAVKVLKGRASDKTEQARLRREAKLMASLTHNNVASVFDVGLHDGRVFIAMELIEGVTLRRWLDEARSWRTVVDVMTAAGRGLAAAHAAGVVHRDFKPENIMVADDGRVVVMDFGIARDTAGAEQPDAGPELATTGPRLDASTTGGLGTPRYMAPEQHLWRPTDARTDQFAFCVVAYEALYRQRPFAGDTWPELVATVTAGKVQPRPATTTVPAGVHRAISRGLAVEPDDRFSSIADLLAALAARDHPRRWPWALAVAGGVAAAGAITWFGSARETCEDGAIRIAAVYGETQRTAAADAFVASGLPFAEDAWKHARGSLDAYANAWQDSYRQACRSRDDELDLRMTCLDAARVSLEVNVARFTTADAAVVERAQSLARLPPLARCDDPSRFAAEVPRPQDETQRDAVSSLRARLVEVQTLYTAGRDEDALAAAQALAADARAVGFAPAVAEVLVAVGDGQARAAQYAAALQTFERAAGIAAEHGHDRVAAVATAMGLGVVHPNRNSEAEIVRWLGHARAALQRWTQAGGVETGSFEWAAGQLALRHDDLDTARARFERMLEITEQTGNEILQADALAKLAHIAARQRRYDAALDYGQRGIAVGQRALGSRHPRVATYLSNLGDVRLARGELEAARELNEQAVAQLQQAYGGQGQSLAGALHGLGRTAAEQSRYEDALAYFEAAEAAMLTILDEAHPVITSVRGNRGVMLDKLGRYEEARTIHARALELTERDSGPDSPAVAGVLDNLGSALQGLERFEEARALHERARAIFERAGDPHTPDLAVCLVDLGRAHIGLGETSRARELLTRAVEIFDQTGALATDRAHAQELLEGLEGSQ